MTSSAEPGRTPPRAVLRALRQEVRFHCPVPAGNGICGSPYLTWHHFDPPWRVEKHHRVEGMIALCRQHADKADNGSFTDDQLRRFKIQAALYGEEVRGRFDWMRNDLVAYAGGNFYSNTHTLIEIDGTPAVWFERNEYGELMLNYRMPPLPTDRTHIVNNLWHVNPADVDEMIAPPNGRTLSVTYTNGDRFGVEFRAINTPEEFIERFPGAALHSDAVDSLRYPTTVASITDIAANRSIVLRPDRTVTGSGQVNNSWFEGGKVGIALRSGAPLQLTEEQNAAIASALRAFNTRSGTATKRLR